jgi:uncharacterized protein YdeI (YjbR/CyaY-like superfamily)
MRRSGIARSRSRSQPAKELPVVRFAEAGAWERWLEDHHDHSPGVWLTLAKQKSGVVSVTQAEALSTALCFGWIDGQLRGLDERFYLQRFTPRRRRSRWSQINRAKAEALIAAGRMRESGLARIREAQADGRWEAAYEPQSRATVPDDLRRALDGCPEAREFFETLTGSHRYAFLYRLHHVSSPDQRARRIATYIELLRDRRTLT